jgi:Protein of unknown function (DUF3179)
MTVRNNSNLRRIGWLALPIIILLSLAIVIVPVWIVQPFKAETQRGLAISYAMRRWSPSLTIAALIISFVLVGWLWRGLIRWFAKVALIIMLLPLLLAAWFARQNHFEWMFNPLTNTAYAKSSDASFIDDKDMVLGVANNGEAVAYPVRLMAYHHVAEDVVGGTPIIATY